MTVVASRVAGVESRLGRTGTATTSLSSNGLPRAVSMSRIHGWSADDCGTTEGPTRYGVLGTVAFCLHDARHSGASTADGPTKGTVCWRRKLEGGVTPGPVVGADGTIYVASNGGVLHALNPADGTDRWTYDSGRPAAGDLSISPLVLPDGTVLFPAGNWPTALSPTGRPLWSKEFDGRVTSPATTDGKRVYLGTTSGTVTALDIATPTRARITWRTNVGTIYSADAVHRLKLAPEPYHHVLDTEDITPADAVLIAAHDWDVAGAAAAGLTTAFVPPGDRIPLPAGQTPAVSGPTVDSIADQLIATAGR